MAYSPWGHRESDVTEHKQDESNSVRAPSHLSPLVNCYVMLSFLEPKVRDSLI